MDKDLGNIIYDGTKVKIRYELIGHKVVEVERVNDKTARLYLDNGIVLQTVGNDGCGGCTAGHYYLTDLNGCDNVITDVSFETRSAGIYGDEDFFTIFVFAEDQRIKLVEYNGWDNGYYGRGFDVLVSFDTRF